MALLDQLDVDRRFEGHGVVLQRPRGEADLADLARQRPPEVLPVEQSFDLALAALGDVEAVAVEEPHDD